MRDRAQKQAKMESEFKKHHGDPVRFDEIPWPYFIKANMPRLLSTNFQYSVSTLDDAYDILDATPNYTINQINKYYRKRMLFWHSDRFQYEFNAADLAKVNFSLHCQANLSVYSNLMVSLCVVDPQGVQAGC